MRPGTAFHPAIVNSAGWLKWNTFQSPQLGAVCGSTAAGEDRWETVSFGHGLAGFGCGQVCVLVVQLSRGWARSPGAGLKVSQHTELRNPNCSAANPLLSAAVEKCTAQSRGLPWLTFLQLCVLSTAPYGPVVIWGHLGSFGVSCPPACPACSLMAWGEEQKRPGCCVRAAQQ